MTSHADSEEILTDQQIIEKVTYSNTSIKPHTLKTLQKKKYMPGSEQRGAVLEKKKQQQGNTPRQTTPHFTLKKKKKKKQVMD